MNLQSAHITRRSILWTRFVLYFDLISTPKYILFRFIDSFHFYFLKYPFDWRGNIYACATAYYANNNSRNWPNGEQIHFEFDLKDSFLGKTESYLCFADLIPRRFSVTSRRIVYARNRIVLNSTDTRSTYTHNQYDFHTVGTRVELFTYYRKSHKTTLAVSSNARTAFWFLISERIAD